MTEKYAKQLEIETLNKKIINDIIKLTILKSV